MTVLETIAFYELIFRRVLELRKLNICSTGTTRTDGDDYYDYDNDVNDDFL